ncbi:unnamed protein product, partial [Mesorhabditis spiculigera]
MAKRLPSNFQIKDEASFQDPLANYCDGSSFSIVEFITNGDTPGDSPLTGRHHHNPQDPHHGGVMYQNGRLPDSPPITEISAPGSSASPHSSNSESPYSPNEYTGYGLLPHNGNNGLILAPNDLSLMGQQTDIFQQQLPGMNGRLIQNQGLTSPQSVNGGYLNNYPQQPTPASMTQVSPQPQGQRMNNNGNYFDSGMLYQNNSGSDGSINSAGMPSSKKRPRVMPMANSLPPQGQMQQMLQSPCGNDYDENGFHNSEMMIRFFKFQEESWQPLFDVNHQQLNQLQTHVVADKGFNYSSMDNCFVNQKKNHFQITVNIEAADCLPARFVRVNGEMKEIKEFRLGFTGVKNEMWTSEIPIKQSQTDRRPQPHTPVTFEITERRLTKVTVPRLHFSETTQSNQRKGGKPNPDQRYFLLIVRIFAVTADDHAILCQAYNSDKVIVRVRF